MRFDAITLFPQMFEAVTRFGITRRAYEQGLWQFAAVNPRDFTTDRHRTVDDRPFGGGPGMVMLAEPLVRAVESARQAQAAAGCRRTHVIALTAAGTPLTDARVRALAAERELGVVLVCGRYEGIDQRFLDACVDEQISIGDFVMSGGEIAAMALIDAVVRHLPGVLKPDALSEESFASGLLDAPQYTRPEVWRGQAVPSVLLSGHHAQIARWRRAAALAMTARVRPDLIAKLRAEGRLSAQDLQVLQSLRSDAQAAAGGAPAVNSAPSADVAHQHHCRVMMV
ncbi:MAG: tRNA (guanosine(37)-N1)-methyltransferase TrmD [Sutterellaceae bacterium]|nr:tRNA (guanosine(37)-N1)-methyltransferase TrmD [Burkholderiaceae bacterium]MCX7901013.1 tRNA (guanosine(37)-N1)-methyltransferase TrmD [Burkholderiaceae bacterium]MDW8430361.1 tRNA (guanosine(37)-N1)-methyltransferase TrmD [Sutterellaceae bacterium]